MVFGGLAHGLLGVLAEQGLHHLAPAEWRRELRVGKSAGVGFSETRRDWYDTYVLEDGKISPKQFKMGIRKIIAAVYLPGEEPLLDVYVKIWVDQDDEVAELSSSAQDEIHQLTQGYAMASRSNEAMKADLEELDKLNEELNGDKDNLVAMVEEQLQETQIRSQDLDDTVDPF